jgi:hypothetical protein
VTSRAAPHPPSGLAVAIVGHRPARIVDADRVQDQLRSILARVRAALPPSARLRLVSALAEGADRMGAAAAPEIGAALDVVLPFAPHEYEKDFDEEASRHAFRALLAQAEAVLVLDGAADARDLAYEAAGRTLLDNSDLVVAVWDGQPGRGRGGTQEVLADAARRQMPIVVVTPDGSSATVLQAEGTRDPQRLDDLWRQPIEALDHALIKIAAIAPATLTAQVQWLAAAQLPPTGWVHGAYPLLLRLIGLGRKRRKGSGDETEAPRGELDEAFAWWDDTAVRAAQSFRSAVIINFALAALAVVLAAFSVLAGPAKWLFVIAEVATILLLLANNWHAGRSRWQERWLEAREAAEMLRVTRMLREAGIGRASASNGEQRGASAYASALARGLPIRDTDFSAVHAAGRGLVEEVTDQASWNEANAARMHKAAHRIERIGELLFAAVLVAAVGWLILYLSAPATAERLKYGLTAVTAGLPAIATASYGIRIILDFEGVAERSRHMAAALRSLLARWEASPPTVAALQAFARDAADIMLGDVAAWRLLAEARRLTIPG